MDLGSIRKKEMKKKMESFALVPCMVVAGLLALHMLSVMAVVGPMPLSV